MKTPALLSARFGFHLPPFAAHGVGLGQPPKYPANFTAFEYVNPNAPKAAHLPRLSSVLLTRSTPYPQRQPRIRHQHADARHPDRAKHGRTLRRLRPDCRRHRLAPDGLSVTFKINPKAKFHNGDPVLAKDVAASFNIPTKDKAAAPMYHFYWSDVAKVETPNDRTVVFRFKQRNSELHMILGSPPVFLA